MTETAKTHKEFAESAELDGLIGLRDAAEQLDVHYMTAYRYVRTGRLDASKVGGRWWIDKQELADIMQGSTARALSPRPRSELVEPLMARLISSDFAGAWQLVEGALASGATPTEVHAELLGPAMARVGELWCDGLATIADEHRASSTCQRIVGRMSSLFRPPGRRRGSVLLGAIAGDSHGLPSAMLADMLEAEHLAVIDLGSNTPTASFLEVARTIDDLVGVGIVATLTPVVDDAANACVAVKDELPHVVTVVGGAGVQGAAAESIQSRVDVVSYSAADARTAFVAAAARAVDERRAANKRAQVSAVG